MLWYFECFEWMSSLQENKTTIVDHWNIKYTMLLIYILLQQWMQICTIELYTNNKASTNRMYVDISQAKLSG